MLSAGVYEYQDNIGVCDGIDFPRLALRIEERSEARRLWFAVDARVLF